MITHAPEFLAEIEAFLEKSKMSATALGKEAINDPSFVRDLREKSREPRWSTAERIRAFMRDRSTSEVAQ